MYLRKQIPLLLILATLLCAEKSYGEENRAIERVHVVFKTHLDVGFTDLSSEVTDRYINEFIPKAIEVSEKLRANGRAERYVWTTGSWLIEKYLEKAAENEKKRLERAITNGDIVWNGVPYTVESEVMSKELFESTLMLSKKLDNQYGKRTIAAKMTDVPGHTRSIIPIMSRQGITLLHIGVNPASQVPNVPEIARWRDKQGAEIILIYQKDYGTEALLPDGKSVISVNFTGDNHGPHSYEKVLAIYADLREKYPNAQLIGSSFNEIADELTTVKDRLPVITSEIGDTWIYGYGSAPMRMAKFRALQRLYHQWIEEGKLKQESRESIAFAIELGLIAEHTQGMDVKTHLHNWDKYDQDLFIKSLELPAFKKMEQSWAEVDHYIYSAIAYLPTRLQKEALQVVEEIEQFDVPRFSSKAKVVRQAPHEIELLNKKIQIEGISRRTYDNNDYNAYLDKYLRARYGWALDDIGKTGLKESEAKSEVVTTLLIKKEDRKKDGILYALDFSNRTSALSKQLPEEVLLNVTPHKSGKKVNIELYILNKPKVRLPESYWISFQMPEILSYNAEKTGEEVDLFDVVERGNRQMHGIDRYIDLITKEGKIRIWSKDAFLVVPSEARGINYSTSYPEKNGTLHFNLSNNLWGTNFGMWSWGHMRYRFTIEWID